MKSDHTRRAVGRAVIALAVGMLMVGGIALGVGFGGVVPGIELRVIAAAGFAVGAIGLWLLHDFLSLHFRALHRLESYAEALAAGQVPSAEPAGDDQESVGRLRDLLSTLAAQRRQVAAAPDARLTAVLAEVSEALLLITPDAQISLVNGPARALLGSARLAIGTSAFDALDRTTLVEAMRRAASAGAPVEATLATIPDGRRIAATVVDLREHRGILICIRASAAAGAREVEHDLTLHDLPPPAPPPDGTTPLGSVPVLVLDCETTGLDPSRDRIVALGAVRMSGGRIFRGTAIDLLVRPDIAVPPRATAIHGIDDAMLRDAPPFAAQASTVLGHLAGTVVVGHNIGFDLAVLKAEAGRAGIAWPDVPSLCTARLAAALDPDEAELDLDAVAARHGVAVEGRHTALGDSLVTAELFAHMLPRLQAQGIATFGAAQDFAASAKRVVARQRAAGW